MPHWGLLRQERDRKKVDMFRPRHCTCNVNITQLEEDTWRSHYAAEELWCSHEELMFLHTT